MNMHWRLGIWIGVCAAACAPSGEQTNAAEVDRVSARASSQLIGGFHRRALFAVDGMGLTGSAHGIVPDGAMWLSNGTFADRQDTDPEITFDLGGVHTIDTMKVWNYNEFLPGRDDLLDRGIRFADVQVAGEDLVFSTLISAQELTIAPGNETDDFGQLIPLDGAAARYVKLANLVNYGNAENFVGLSEVQFLVPEPASLTLWGLAAAMLFARRRRR